jgi:hypothetical protein
MLGAWQNKVLKVVQSLKFVSDPPPIARSDQKQRDFGESGKPSAS